MHLIVMIYLQVIDFYVQVMVIYLEVKVLFSEGDYYISCICSNLIIIYHEAIIFIFGQ